MSIKRSIKILPVFFLMAISIQVNASSTFAISRIYPRTYIVNNDSLRMEQINRRLAVIQTMDLSNLSLNEKRNLKKELITMKKDAQSMDYEGGGHHSGVYISVGAIIIIILLLILLR